jgi:hypothetical protein
MFIFYLKNYKAHEKKKQNLTKMKKNLNTKVKLQNFGNEGICLTLD